MPIAVVLVILIAAVCLLCGPIALIIAVNVWNKVNSLSFDKPQKSIPICPAPQPKVTPQAPPPVIFGPMIQAAPVEEKIPAEILPKKVFVSDTYHEKENFLIEQKIGTWWILVAGLVTSFVGVAFFLKFAYVNFSLSPISRIIGVAVCGFVALAAGEITRRRGYDIVAKGVTALGFAVLYAAVFAAYQFYNLIGSVPAFIFALTITAAAMIYAVTLNEILIAFLSLLGGLATPLILLTKIDSPTPLFVYILILGAGAMLCASYRKWPAINFLAFAGSYLLFSIWYFQVSQKSAVVNSIPTRTYTLSWLAVFFALYLLMPLIHSLIRKVKTRQQDPILILANAIVTYFFLCNILYDYNRTYLAAATLIMSAVHLSMMALAAWRCKQDTNLKIVLAAVGLFLLTIAVPLYYHANALVLAWTGQAVVMTIIGLRYRSVSLQVIAIIPLAMSIGVLINQLQFREDLPFIFNRDFGTWCIVAAAVFILHAIYRFLKPQHPDMEKAYSTATQILYSFGSFLLFFAIVTEWIARYNHIESPAKYPAFYQGLIVICIPFILLLVIRPIAPKGIYHKFFGAACRRGIPIYYFSFQ